jgi:hypothetical protein
MISPMRLSTPGLSIGSTGSFFQSPVASSDLFANALLVCRPRCTGRPLGFVILVAPRKNNARLANRVPVLAWELPTWKHAVAKLKSRPAATGR